MITNWVRRCANTGTTITNEGIEGFKVCEVATSTTNKEGEQVASKNWLIIINCKDFRAHHMIYDHQNQQASHQMRIGINVFDHEGTRYPDKTTSEEPLDEQVFAAPRGTSKTETTAKDTKSSDLVSKTKKEEDRCIRKKSDSNRSRKPRRD